MAIGPVPVHPKFAVRLLNVKHVAKAFSVHPATVHRWIRRGLLPSVPTPTGKRRVRPEDFARFLEEGPPPPPGGQGVAS